MRANLDNQVAVFIDYENIELSFRSNIDEDVEVDWSRVLEAAVDLGRVVIRRAYADWSNFRNNQRELLGLGIDLIHVASKRGKNAADIRIVIDAMEMLIGEHSHLSHVLLVSGDGDFTELVHQLRAKGKVVVGMGISGASAEYLINACDQFIYYDKLDVGTGAKGRKGDEETAVSFDVSEARQLLRRAMYRQEGEWMSAGKLKSAMRGLNPAFSERNYDFSSFKAFLSEQDDLVKLRTAEGGHLEAQLLPEAPSKVLDSSPEAILDRYLKLLAQQKIHMTPTEHRPTIILRFFDIIKNNPGRTLNEQKEDLHAYFEEEAPQVKYQYIHETVHQLFHTYCFEFDQDHSNYSANVRLWDRQVSLVNSIRQKSDMLDRCDRGLLQKIGRKLGDVEKLNREVSARLLYGSVKGQRMLERIDTLIEKLAEERG